MSFICKQQPIGTKKVFVELKLINLRILTQFKGNSSVLKAVEPVAEFEV